MKDKFPAGKPGRECHLIMKSCRASLLWLLSTVLELSQRRYGYLRFVVVVAELAGKGRNWRTINVTLEIFNQLMLDDRIAHDGKFVCCAIGWIGKVQFNSLVAICSYRFPSLVAQHSAETVGFIWSRVEIPHNQKVWFRKVRISNVPHSEVESYMGSVAPPDPEDLADPEVGRTHSQCLRSSNRVPR